MKVAQKTLWKRKAYDKIINDNFIGEIFKNPPNQIDEWIDANIKNEADTKKLFKKLLYSIRYLILHQTEVPNGRKNNNVKRGI